MDDAKQHLLYQAQALADQHRQAKLAEMEERAAREHADQQRRRLLGQDNAILINFNRDDLPHLFDDLKKDLHTGMHIDAMRVLMGETRVKGYLIFKFIKKLPSILCPIMDHLKYRSVRI